MSSGKWLKVEPVEMMMKAWNEHLAVETLGISAVVMMDVHASSDLGCGKE